MKITIARLRSNVKYNGPLETVLDSFFENYVKFMRANPQHEYRTYNVSFDTSRPKRTPETIEWADVIVIPSDSEFRYHGELQMNPKDLAKSESHMETIRPFFEGKDVIMFRSDRGDTEELYRSFLPGIRNFTTIDEVDFSGNIHGMKYHFIQTLKNPLADMFDEGKSIDFAYWGRLGKWSVPEEKNVRERIIRQIYRSELSTVLVGGGSSRTVGGVTGALQVEGTAINDSSITMISNGASGTDGLPAKLVFGRTGAASLGSSTVVADGNEIGVISFQAADGTDIESQAASIFVAIDGTPGGNDTPGRMIFATCANGSAGASERMRITEKGQLLVGTASLLGSSNALIHVNVDKKIFSIYLSIINIRFYKIVSLKVLPE